MDRHGFTRTVAWYGEKGGPAAHFIDRPAFGGSSLYVQVRQPSLYYRIGALALWGASGGQPARLDPDVALYLVRGGSLILQVILVALGGVAAAWLTPGQPGAGLRVALPLGLALLADAGLYPHRRQQRCAGRGAGGGYAGGGVGLAAESARL